MRWFCSAAIALAFLLISDRCAKADPISLYFWDGGVDGDVGRFTFPGQTLNLSYSSHGGSIDFIASSLGVTSSDVQYPNPAPQYAINGPFGFLVAVKAPGENDAIQGPVLSVEGQVTGSITGPGGGSTRWSGTYSGRATSASLLQPSMDSSQLPAPLLDILTHPDHLHLSAVVDGGNRNYLDVTLTLDPPSPSEVPEPTALVTLTAAAAGLSLRRWWRRARDER